jgi:trehalose synthase
LFTIIEVDDDHCLDDYAANAQLASAVQDLRSEASVMVPELKGRAFWMVSSTAQGGGVAEMMPKLVSLLREVGVKAKWAVIGTERREFFQLTKRLHNLAHGHGDPSLTAEDRELYETVSREVAQEMQHQIGPNDILAVHDPHPAGVGALLKQQRNVKAVWRCHIGLDRHTPQTRAAWDFLRPYVEHYDHAVFSAPEYIPEYLTGNVSVIHPALDPLSEKNRELSPHMVTGVLVNAGLMRAHHPVLTAEHPLPVLRLRSDGRFGNATEPEEIGFLYRTIVTQVSRWDHLKGWLPLLEGFARLKRENRQKVFDISDYDARRIEIARLVLAGPEPSSNENDPDAERVLADVCRQYLALDADVQADIALLKLSTASRRMNALTVNAIQRCSSVVVQNSLAEGFGLSCTEAMWKRCAVLGTTACGLRQQIRDGVDGRLLRDPTDPDHIKQTLLELLSDNEARVRYGRSAQRRASDEFLVFTQSRRWLEVMIDVVRGIHSSVAPY